MILSCICSSTLFQVFFFDFFGVNLSVLSREGKKTKIIKRNKREETSTFRAALRSRGCSDSQSSPVSTVYTHRQHVGIVLHTTTATLDSCNDQIVAEQVKVDQPPLERDKAVQVPKFQQHLKKSENRLGELSFYLNTRLSAKWGYDPLMLRSIMGCSLHVYLVVIIT